MNKPARQRRRRGRKYVTTGATVDAVKLAKIDAMTAEGCFINRSDAFEQGLDLLIEKHDGKKASS